MTIVLYLFVITAGYLIGAIPSGLIVGKLYRGVDVRQYGSQRTGATNVLRTLGPGASAVVLLADALKGAVVVLIARLLLAHLQPFWVGPLGEVLAALAAMVGHNWPVYIGFRGGRGVAVSVGSMAVLVPLASVVGVLVGVAVIALSRFVSLGSVVGTIIAALFIIGWVALGLAPQSYVLFSVVAGSVIVLQHRDNIGRLLAGTERKLGQPVPPTGTQG